MTLNGVMAVIFRYLTEIGTSGFGGHCYVTVDEVRVECRSTLSAKNAAKRIFLKIALLINNIARVLI